MAAFTRGGLYPPHFQAAQFEAYAQAPAPVEALTCPVDDFESGGPYREPHRRRARNATEAGNRRLRGLTELIDPATGAGIPMAQVAEPINGADVTRLTLTAPRYTHVSQFTWNLQPLAVFLGNGQLTVLKLDFDFTRNGYAVYRLLGSATCAQLEELTLRWMKPKPIGAGAGGDEVTHAALVASRLPPHDDLHYVLQGLREYIHGGLAQLRHIRVLHIDNWENARTQADSHATLDALIARLRTYHTGGRMWTKTNLKELNIHFRGHVRRDEAIGAKVDQLKEACEWLDVDVQFITMAEF
ncbi:hypothetical protein MIND_01239500 [Mycena indigotica]|uniref:Uncharacterized protein n=1 Tax=Mycena indigotica TaxID=2126181 RepID=A0A8H6S4L4_9AGAR|nr:uncharacterized protein MIND_01239500 [Mycena indigotica]KAF7292125.1 hypothetical protein MIND_01239500 [Mycena indigotica]